MKVFEKQKKSIACQYQEGLSSVELADRYSVSGTTILRVLKEQNVALRSLSEAAREYSFNIEVFNNPTTEEAAYWLGFLMADGSVYQSGRKYKYWYVKLGLALRDIGHIRKFLSFLQSTYPIKQRISKIGDKSYKSCDVVICSDALAQVLQKFGIVPNKSCGAKICDELKHNRHFWRGVVDGDGWITDSCKDGKDTRSAVQLCGSKELLTQYRDFLKSNVLNFNSSVCKHKNIYAVCVANTTADNVIELLYANCKVALDRKHQVAMKAMWGEELYYAV